MPHLVLPPPPPAVVQSLTTVDASSTKKLTIPSASVTAKSLPAITPPTTLAPEPSSTSVAKSAALLGSDLSVGSPQQFETSSNSPSSDSVGFTQPLEETESFPIPPSLPPQSAPVLIKLTDTSQLKSQLLAQKLPAGTSLGKQRIVELSSKRQVYDQQRQIVTAEGNVVLRTEGTVINADRLQVNLANLIAVAEGKILLTAGRQVLRGERLTYNFIQDDGQIFNARGEIYTPSAGTDFSPTDIAGNGLPPETPSDRIPANQPLQGISSAGGIGVTVGAGRSASNIPLTQQGGQIKRLRFEAERVDFYPQGWQASNVRITNDPFSPPELEVRADKVTLTHETPFQDRIRTSRQRLVFDQGISVPIPKNEAVIDRRRREVSPAIAQIGIDGNERGGVFIERGFTPINTPGFRLRVAPQFLLQRAIQKSGGLDPSSYGLRANLDGDLGPRTSLRGLVNFTSFDLNNLDNTLRASLRLRQIIGSQLPHTLSLEYSFRDRLFNGSLGFQTVQSSLGGIITSPTNIPLGKTGINLNYQGGAQYVTADTDRLNLLPLVRQNNRVSLGRVQASATLSRGFLLWQGKGLPATATEGLKYTATPVVPYLQAYGVVQGVTGYYTSGDNQESLTGTIGLVGQFGHSSRPFLDYTNFNLSYSQGLRVGQSPFLFDRFADSQVLSAGFLQQLYGPVRLGVQTTYNVGTGQQISTDFILEYSRRTYGVLLRYNPLLGLGSLSLRISDFNWVGGSNPFTDSGIKPVVNGVPQENNYFP